MGDNLNTLITHHFQTAQFRLKRSMLLYKLDFENTEN